MIRIEGVSESVYSSKSITASVNPDGSVQITINETAGPSSLGGAGIKLTKEDFIKLSEVLKP